MNKIIFKTVGEDIDHLAFLGIYNNTVEFLTALSSLAVKSLWSIVIFPFGVVGVLSL